MLANFANSWTEAGKAYCGLEAEFTTPDGLTTLLYIADGFDPAWVRTPGSVDVIYNSVRSSFRAFAIRALADGGFGAFVGFLLTVCACLSGPNFPDTRPRTRTMSSRASLGSLLERGTLRTPSLFCFVPVVLREASRLTLLSGQSH